MQLAQRRALGADVAAAPDIVVVRPDAGDPVVLDFDAEAAHGLAEWARAEMFGRRHRAVSRSRGGRESSASGTFRSTRLAGADSDWPHMPPRHLLMAILPCPDLGASQACYARLGGMRPLLM